MSALGWKYNIVVTLSENTRGGAVSCIARLDAFSGLVPGFQVQLASTIDGIEKISRARAEFLRELAFSIADVRNNQMSYEARRRQRSHPDGPAAVTQ